MVKLVRKYNTLLLNLMAVRKQAHLTGVVERLVIDQGGKPGGYIWDYYNLMTPKERLEWKERGQTEVSSTNLK